MSPSMFAWMRVEETGAERAATRGGRSQRRRQRRVREGLRRAASASSSERTTTTPDVPPAGTEVRTSTPPPGRHPASRVITMLVRPGSGLPIDSNVLRPMSIGLPSVRALKYLQVVGQVPRHAVVAADDVVLGRRDHHRDNRHARIPPPSSSTTTPRPGMRKNSAACALRRCMRAKNFRCNPRQPGSRRARRRADRGRTSNPRGTRARREHELREALANIRRLHEPEVRG